MRNVASKRCGTCECSDGSTWTSPPGPCADGSYDIQSFTCSGDGTVGSDQPCPKGEKITGGTCDDFTTFNFNLPTPGGRGDEGRGAPRRARRARGYGKR